MITFLFSFLFIHSVVACDFAADVKNVYSLSGSTTLALRDLKLLNHSKLKGVSVFHPIDKKDFKGQFMPGGVFLSHESLKSLQGSHIFYDESRELTRMLARHPEIKAIEVRTRSLSPREALRATEVAMQSALQGCDFSRLTKKMDDKLVQLKQLIKQRPTILFFLGKIQFGKWPEMLMVQDGVVKWMIEEKLIVSYPSELPYVNWSSKILNSLSAKTLKVGIKDSGSEMTFGVEKSEQNINLTFPGALIPGFGQVDAMIYLFKNI